MVWYSQKKGASSTRLLGMDEFDHGTVSDDNEPRDDMDVTTTP